MECHVLFLWCHEYLLLQIVVYVPSLNIFKTIALSVLYIDCLTCIGYYKSSMSDDGQHFVHVSGEGSEDGFNNPMITLKFCNSANSVLDEEIYMDDTLPLDSLNGACQFAKSEPSPFSSRRHMHDSDQESPESDEKTEQVML